MVMQCLMEAGWKQQVNLPQQVTFTNFSPHLLRFKKSETLNATDSIFDSSFLSQGQPFKSALTIFSFISIKFNVLNTIRCWWRKKMPFCLTKWPPKLKIWHFSNAYWGLWLTDYYAVLGQSMVQSRVYRFRRLTFLRRLTVEKLPQNAKNRVYCK